MGRPARLAALMLIGSATWSSLEAQQALEAPVTHTHKLAGFAAGVTVGAVVTSLDDLLGSSCIGSGSYLPRMPDRFRGWIVGRGRSGSLGGNVGADRCASWTHQTGLRGVCPRCRRSLLGIRGELPPRGCFQSRLPLWPRRYGRNGPCSWGRRPGRSTRCPARPGKREPTDDRSRRGAGGRESIRLRSYVLLAS